MTGQRRHTCATHPRAAAEPSADRAASSLSAPGRPPPPSDSFASRSRSTAPARAPASAQPSPTHANQDQRNRDDDTAQQREKGCGCGVHALLAKLPNGRTGRVVTPGRRFVCGTCTHQPRPLLSLVGLSRLVHRGLGLGLHPLPPLLLPLLLQPVHRLPVLSLHTTATGHGSGHV
jgi:hypothetical protein